MEKQLNDIDLIEKFLEGSLIGKELESFNERLKSDKPLADALSQRKRIQELYIEASKRIELKKQIQSAISTVKQRSAFQQKVWLVAASLVVIIGVGSFFLFQQKQPSGSNIAERKISQEDDKLVSPSRKKMEEYGSYDSLPVKSKVTNDFLPADGAIFHQTDTILFTRHNDKTEVTLKITDKNDSLIKKVTMQAGVSEYKLLPNSLKPGKYSWNYSPEGVSRSLIIK